MSERLKQPALGNFHYRHRKRLQCLGHVLLQHRALNFVSVINHLQRRGMDGEPLLRKLLNESLDESNRTRDRFPRRRRELPRLGVGKMILTKDCDRERATFYPDCKQRM